MLRLTKNSLLICVDETELMPETLYKLQNLSPIRTANLLNLGAHAYLLLAELNAAKDTIHELEAKTKALSAVFGNRP